MRAAAIALVALALVGSATAAFTARTETPAGTLATSASFGCDYPGLVTGTTGVQSLWRLGESAGTTAADALGAYAGTYGGTHTKAVADAIAADPDTAVRFAGGYVDIGDNLDFTGTAGFTLEAWIRPTTIDGTTRRIVSKAAGGLQGYELWVNSSSGIGFDRIAGTKNTVTTAAPTLNAWTHLVATYDGTTMRLYVNGSPAGSTASGLSLIDNAAALRLGNSESGTEGWAGDLDDISIYSGALGAAEVESHFRCGRRYRDLILDTPGLQSYWRLGEPSGLTAYDSKGSVSGTLTNGLAWGGAGATTTANGAAVYDGVDDFIDFGDAYDFAGTSSFSVEGWINRTALGEADKWRWILAKESVVDPRDGWAVMIAPDASFDPQAIYFDRIAGGTEQVAASTTATTAGTWFHFAATYDGSTMRVYVNGVLEDSTASSVSLPNTTFPLRSGSAAPPSVHRFAGRIDELAVYNTALSATQILEHYRAR